MSEAPEATSLITPGDALAWAASQARAAARGIAEQGPPGRFVHGAVTALLEFAVAIDPPIDPPNGPAPTSAPAATLPSPLAAIDATSAAPDLRPSPAADSLSNFEAGLKARLKGHTGDACPDCGSFSMVRNGMCLKCVACGATTGCS